MRTVGKIFVLISAWLVLALGVFTYLLLHRTEGRYLDADGIRLFYTDEGSGEPIVLVHGFGAQGDWNWRRTGLVRKLRQHYRVITFDLRGHGLSDKPHAPEAYGIEMVEDVRRVMDACGIERAHIAGYSLGGGIVLKFLTRYPERVKSALVCASGWVVPDAEGNFHEPYSAPPPPEAAAVPLYDDAGNLVVTPQARPSKEVPLDASQQQNETRGVRKTIKRLLNRIEDHLVDRDAKRACRKSWPALNITEEEVRSIQTPVACLIGSQDGLLRYAQALRGRIPNLTYIEIPNANHFTTAFRPEFHEAFLNFLERKSVAGEH
jgi:pimeloyl-ACP methyl ester carboxylesterase